MCWKLSGIRLSPSLFDQLLPIPQQKKLKFFWHLQRFPVSTYLYHLDHLGDSWVDEWAGPLTWSYHGAVPGPLLPGLSELARAFAEWVGFPLLSWLWPGWVWCWPTSSFPRIVHSWTAEACLISLEVPTPILTASSTEGPTWCVDEWSQLYPYPPRPWNVTPAVICGAAVRVVV